MNQPEQDFGPQQVITTSADDAWSVYATDLDGDGDADVLSVSLDDDKIEWYENRLNQPEQDFGSQQVISTSAHGAQSVFAVDLDSDGDADVLSASYNQVKIAWYENRLNRAEQDFGPWQNITNSVTFPQAVYAEDLDNDGDADVIYAWSNAVSISFNLLELTKQGVELGSTQWSFADGDTRQDAQTYILVNNPSIDPTSLTLTVLFEDQAPLTLERTAEPFSRYTFRLHNELPALAVDPTSFGCVLNSVLPVHAERAMYWSEPGWRDGVATPTFRARATAAIGARE